MELSAYQEKQVEQLYYAGLNPQDIAQELELDELAVMEYCTNYLFR